MEAVQQRRHATARLDAEWVHQSRERRRLEVVGSSPGEDLVRMLEEMLAATASSSSSARIAQVLRRTGIDFRRMTDHAEQLRRETVRPVEETYGAVRPQIGDRVELRLPRMGRHLRGTVHYVDELQILVKWDDGRSENLRSTYPDRIRILPADDR